MPFGGGGNIVYGTPPGGGYQVTTPGYGGDLGGGFGGGDLSWLGAAARRSAQNKLRMQELQLKEAEKARRSRPVTRYDAASQGGSPMERMLKAEGIKTEIAKQRAMRSQAPKKWIGGGAYGAGALIEAPENYSGVERQIFLPQDAGFTGPSLQETDTANRKAGEDWWKEVSPEEKQKRATQYLASISGTSGGGGSASQSGGDNANQSLSDEDWMRIMQNYPGMGMATGLTPSGQKRK